MQSNWPFPANEIKKTFQRGRKCSSLFILSQLKSIHVPSSVSWIAHLLAKLAVRVTDSNPDRPFRNFGASRTGDWRIFGSAGTRRTLSQFWSFKIRRTTFPNLIKFADLLIRRLQNSERVRRERRTTDFEALKLWNGWSGIRLWIREHQNFMPSPFLF